MCSMLPAYLENLGIEYTENGVDIHPEEGMNIVAKTEKLAIPQLCINDVWVSRFNLIKIIAQLKKKN